MNSKSCCGNFSSQNKTWTGNSSLKYSNWTPYNADVMGSSGAQRSVFINVKEGYDTVVPIQRKDKYVSLGQTWSLQNRYNA